MDRPISGSKRCSMASNAPGQGREMTQERLKRKANRYNKSYPGELVHFDTKRLLMPHLMKYSPLILVNLFVKNLEVSYILLRQEILRQMHAGYVFIYGVVKSSPGFNVLGYPGFWIWTVIVLSRHPRICKYQNGMDKMNLYYLGTGRFDKWSRIIE